MSVKTICSGTPSPIKKLVVLSPNENPTRAGFIAEEKDLSTRSPAANEAKQKRSCCVRICLFFSSCCRSNPASLPQENNNIEEYRPTNPNPTNELLLSTDKRECTTNNVEGNRSTRRKRIFRQIFPCFSTSRVSKQKNYELEPCSTPISRDIAIPEFMTVCNESGQDLIGEDAQSIIEKNRNAPENNQEIEPTTEQKTQYEETGISENSEKSEHVPDEMEIDKGNTPDLPSKDEKDGERKVYGPPKDGGFFMHLLDFEEIRLKNRMALASGRMENLEEGCEEAGKIRVALGKGNLLISKKFKQFRELCQTNLEQNNGAPIPESDAGPTLNEDLEGFWELLVMQVQLIDDMLDDTEASSIPKEQVPVQKKQVRKPVMAPPHSTPKPAAKSKFATDRDEARRKMLAERRAAIKKLPKDTGVEYETKCAVLKFQSDEEPVPGISVAQTPDQVFAEYSETPPICISELKQDTNQQENRQIPGEYFEVSKEIEDLCEELDKLEKMLDSTSPDAPNGQICESELEKLEELMKKLRPVNDSTDENALTSEESEGPIEVLVSAETPPPPDINQGESGVGPTQTRQFEGSPGGQEIKEDGTKKYGLPKPDHKIPEELQNHLEQELDQLEEKLNGISTGGIDSDSYEEIEAVLLKLDELEAEYPSIFSQVGEARFGALH